MFQNKEIKFPCKINKEILDQLSVLDWKIKKLDLKLDSNKINYYLNNISDQKLKTVTQTIIKNTRYITFDEMYNNFLKIIDKLPNKYNLAFLFYEQKIGSEHWLIVLLWPLLKNKCVNLITEIENITNDYPIVLLDDCIYSGDHIFHLANGLLNYYFEKHKKNLINEIIFFTAYRGEHSVKNMNKNYIKNKKYNFRFITREILKSYQFEEQEFMKKHFDSYSKYLIPVYFDHKIANEYGSFPELYQKLMNKEPSREKIKLLNEILTYIIIN